MPNEYSPTRSASAISSSRCTIRSSGPTTRPVDGSVTAETKLSTPRCMADLPEGVDGGGDDAGAEHASIAAQERPADPWHGVRSCCATRVAGHGAHEGGTTVVDPSLPGRQPMRSGSVRGPRI